jgi:hypothetical protein
MVSGKSEPMGTNPLISAYYKVPSKKGSDFNGEVAHDARFLRQRGVP